MNTYIQQKSTAGTVLQIMRAARLYKVAPLLIIVVIAALAAGGPINILALTACCGFLLLVVTLGMHLNAITDRELDQRLKPHLSHWTADSPRALRLIIGAEAIGAVAAAAVALIAVPSWVLFGALLSVALLSISYSFNLFIPHRGAELRAKVHWAGHFLTIAGSYAAIWLMGFSCAEGGFSIAFQISFSAAWALLDYALFLHESANDAEDERLAGLKTLPALLGQRGASMIALGLLALGTIAVLLQMPAFGAAIRACLMFMLILQVAGCLMSAFATRSNRLRQINEQILDFVFWTARTLPAVGLLLMHGAL